ncbi:hypothetical protein A1O3_03039 [Capronia epimyces CBS 606.96]|uniref:tRNA (guanine(9)-N1)-methyltransferase n=1 Tax=Capronia epimyces CBS 606.96 TaxID=1182542 RepID=W9YAV0_9EURO|nr:uncharacterized protein A1O3_03039 [Capronia epimyces CBS 606.96]EXJ89972.1 hypothetical protein A1O3_03039 [Capronia epimyces CBS 606.96]
MEADERPSKLRKLDSRDEPNSKTASDKPLLPAVEVNGAIVPDTDSANHSKPAEHAAANVADPSKEDDDADGSDGSVGPEPTQRNGDPETEPQSTKPMSKNQLKKIRKQEEWEAGRQYRKAKRKQKLQEKRARKRAAREEGEAQQQNASGEHHHQEHNGGTPVPSAAPTAAQQNQDQSQTSLSKPKPRRPVQLPVTILIDCGFDDLMLEKERISLGSQITRSYSDNSRAPYQAHLVISSWGGLLKERFDTVLHKHYLNWKGVTLFETDFVDAARRAEEVMKGPKGGKLAGFFEKFADGRDAQVNIEATSTRALNDAKQAPENANSAAPSEPKTSQNNDQEVSTSKDVPPSPKPESAQRDQTVSDSAPAPPASGEVVYLTSDSPDTLTELHPYSTYIVGGLVDKNRHKGICYKIACERGIKTAKLPIGEYMDMQSRKVLATNHVVEIMIRWLECGDWGEAFMKVIPKRKGGKLRDHELNGGSAAGDEDGEDGEADELDNERNGQANEQGQSVS